MKGVWGVSPLVAAFGDWMYMRQLRDTLYPRAETEVADPAAPAADQEKPAEKPAEEDKEAWADEKDETTGASKPPHDGLCRNCRKRVPLNRFKLCYACWVESEITDREKKEGREWKAGDAHPDWCHCEGLGEHRLTDGSDRRAN